MEEYSREETKEALDKIRDFVQANSPVHDINVTDFKISKNLAAGNGFSVVNRANIWKRDRARVSLNLLSNVVNACCQTYSDDPFEFRSDAIEREELALLLGTVLREMATDGISYILAYIDDGMRVQFKRLSNFNVMYGKCDHADGSDCKAVLYVDKEESKERWMKDKLTLSLNKVLELGKDEIMVLTFWEKGESDGVEGVWTYEVKGSKLTGKIFQPLSRIPVVRFYGKEVFMETWTTWRGFYYQVKDILLTMDYTLSLIQEKIATAPNHLYVIAQEVLGDNLDNWNRLNDIPKAFLAYKSILNVPGSNGDNQVIQLPPPQPNNFVLGIEPLIENYNFHLNLLNQTIGNIAGMSQASETAEAVLLRKENKISAVNELVKNLLDSSYEIASLIRDYTGREVEIVNSIFEKAKNEKDSAMIYNFLSFCQQNELAKFTAPLLVSKMDLTEEEKGMLINGIAESYKPPEAMMKMQGDMEMLSKQNQALSDALRQSQSDIQAQVASAQIRERGLYERKLVDAELKARELELKVAELSMKMKEKGMDARQEAIDTSIDIEKMNNDFDLAQRKIALDAQKIQLENIDKIGAMP